MINLVTVCTDSYPMIYAEKLHKQFRRLSNLKVEHHCITDRPDELPKFVKPIISPLPEVTTAILKNANATKPVRRTPEAM